MAEGDAEDIRYEEYALYTGGSGTFLYFNTNGDRLDICIRNRGVEMSGMPFDLGFGGFYLRVNWHSRIDTA